MLDIDIVLLRDALARTGHYRKDPLVALARASARPLSTHVTRDAAAVGSPQRWGLQVTRTPAPGEHPPHE
ncbi:hypothetical protein [Nannocystis sp. SCPEA4]|uniref:hypothetical protein n=1 Tax=Nannocystis sp. SCPEA4 TaxID=2996787 RepID=UPI00226EEEC7|nr:hypothetical protein [Nannocystis sp. SCPEA4]MCY1057276.1 hypothetical protein [Nannocystis sp. SCPEA4]